jgi:hypothetical protein
MKLEEIRELKICRTEKDVNDALDNGFIIKKILQSKSSNNGEGEEIYPTFVLGKGKK